MHKEYRIVSYGDVWYPEVQSSQGVWQIMANCKTKEEAESMIEKAQENGE